MRALNRRFWSLVALGALVAAAAPSGVSAQQQQAQNQGQQQAQQPSEEARARARQAYAEGQRLFQEGKYREAAAAFQRAYDAVPNPVVLVSVGESLMRAGDVPGAIAAFERYLRERPDAPDKAQVEQKLQQLRSTPGKLRLQSEPAGAQVYVDGELQEGQTPLELELPPGEHTVRITLEGHQPFEQQVQVPPGGEVSVEASLQPEPQPAAEPQAEEEAYEEEGYSEPLPELEEEDVDEPERAPSTAVWVAAGIAAAGLVSGTVFGFLALNEESAFMETPTAEIADRGERYALIADVSFGVGAAAAITALVLHYAGGGSEDGEEEPEATARLRLQPWAGGSRAGLSARLAF